MTVSVMTVTTGVAFMELLDTTELMNVDEEVETKDVCVVLTETTADVLVVTPEAVTVEVNVVEEGEVIDDSEKERVLVEALVDVT